MKSVFWLTVWQNNVCLEPQRLRAARLTKEMKSVFWLTVWQNNVCLEPQRLRAARLTKERIELTRRLRRP